MEQKKLEVAMENLKHEMCMVFPCENQCDICAIGTAIKSIEKQIQMKPKHRIVYPLDCDGGRCPNCMHIINELMDFCEACGQAIDWSIKEEIKND